MWRVALAACAVAGCLGPADHRCADDSACGTGVCVAESQRCAFVTERCCGLEYGGGAGELSHQCVSAVACGDAGIDQDATSDGPVDAPFDAPVDAPVDAPIDAPTDAPIDAPVLTIAHLTAADSTVGTGDLVITGDTVWNTTTGISTLPLGVTVSVARQVPLGPDLMVVHARQFSIRPGATLRVTGSTPLVIIATAASIDGTLDVSANGTSAGVAGGSGGSGLGAGGNGESVPPNEGGGGGAGFGTAGGVGGTDGNTPTARGGAAGMGYGDEPLTTLLGGSGGGAGSDPTTCSGMPVHGGAGGGAIQIFARDTLTISGGIDAGGGGGPGGRQCSTNAESGRGGGSGGAIYLQSPRIDVTGVIAANGGGGGAGSRSTVPTPGTPGADGALSAQPAAGGVFETTTCGGAGGAGAFPPGAGTAVGAADGCGGGGAVGRIVVRRTLGIISGVVSPAPRLLAF